jgi:hypothetical protein
MSDVGPRQKRLGSRVSARQWGSFNQYERTKAQRQGEHFRRRGSFKPPD